MPAVHAEGEPTPNLVERQKRLTQQISIVVSTILFAAFVTYPMYIILQDELKPITIEKPTLQMYETLSISYMNTLTCTCSKPAIPFGQVVQLKYVLHQVCSSDFVKSDWIYNLAVSNGTKFWADFRVTASSAFQTLADICQLTSRTIENNLMEFYSHSFVSVYISNSLDFQTLMNASISQFVLSVINQFSTSFAMIRSTIQNNALLSAIQTNYQLMANNVSQVVPSTRIYDNCSCSTTSMCSRSSAIYSYPNPIKLFNVSGFYIGCYVLDTLLNSNLQCLFDRMCLSTLQRYLDSRPSTPPTELNASAPSRFTQYTPIHLLVDQLMVEQWNPSFDFYSYYSACQPIQCTYTTWVRKDSIYMATMSIGLIGGLIAILNFGVPRVVKFFVFLGLKSEPAVVRTLTVISGR
ncbi:unnamed protein product [Adineta ricciae]|uniref:Uncharacterized protein n=1 Tax=Adineta ricciae TaxID=249248 RepID=A0A813XQX4_ADIRI|nr:unnamed protein product [Adineta ricciae]CAF1338759.1 unnamed protein product [Adineta ricciae]